MLRSSSLQRHQVISACIYHWHGHFLLQHEGVGGGALARHASVCMLKRRDVVLFQAFSEGSACRKLAVIPLPPAEKRRGAGERGRPASPPPLRRLADIDDDESQPLAAASINTAVSLLLNDRFVAREERREQLQNGAGGGGKAGKGRALTCGWLDSSSGSTGTCVLFSAGPQQRSKGGRRAPLCFTAEI